MPATHPEVTSVVVEGGRLEYERSGPRGGVPVIAVHGVTSHRAVWMLTRRELPDVDFAAVDLRGRGGSRELAGPSSLARHVADVHAVAQDAGGGRPVVVAGHSMGAFVAVGFAAAHPELTAGLVLVDGGFEFPPAAAAPDLSLVLSRLSQRYQSREAYREFWRAHPAIGPYWNEAIEHYVDTDVRGEPPALYPGSHPERVAEDMQPVPDQPDPLERVVCPVIALRAPRGLLDDPPGLYPAGWLERLLASRPGFEVRDVDDVNHYTIVLEPRAARLVAAAIRDVLSRVEPPVDF